MHHEAQLIYRAKNVHRKASCTAVHIFYTNSGWHILCIKEKIYTLFAFSSVFML